METIRCPYCDCRVTLADVESHDGTCPECGAPLMGSMLFDPDDEDEENEGLDEDEVLEE